VHRILIVKCVDQSSFYCWHIADATAEWIMAIKMLLVVRCKFVIQKDEEKLHFSALFRSGSGAGKLAAESSILLKLSKAHR